LSRRLMSQHKHASGANRQPFFIKPFDLPTRVDVTEGLWIKELGDILHTDEIGQCARPAVIDGMDLAVFDRRQIGPTRSLEIGAETVVRQCFVCVKTEKHGGGRVCPFRAGDNDDVRLCRKRIFRAERPPVLDLPLGDIDDAEREPKA